MKFLFRLVLLLLVAIPLAALVALALCFQSAPLIARQADLAPADIEQAKRILDAHDPRTARPGALRALVLSQREVDLALNYAANQLRKGSARVVLQPGAAFVQASLIAPPNPFGEWLNVDAVLRETGGLPVFDRLAIGGLPVPGFVANRLLAAALDRLNATGQGTLASDVVKQVNLSADQLRVVYEWRDDIPDRLRSVLLSPADQERFRVHVAYLADVVDGSAGIRELSLTRLLAPMFTLARERSVRGDAAKENRAAIITLAFYVNGRGLGAIIPAARAWRSPAPRKVTLSGRDDFPKHFLISAAIAAEAGSPLADAIGVYKEVEDSRGGSGFSFNDIAADRAGTRFGELAVKSPGRLQDSAARLNDERSYMPDVAGLPEFMPEAEFKRRFGGIGAPAYEKMMAEIERRVAAGPLYGGAR